MAIVRVAREEDMLRILELYQQLAGTTAEVEMYRSLSLERYLGVFHEINDFPGQALLVAEDEGAIIGSLVLVIVPNLSHGAKPWAEIENVIVDQKHRRCGVGRLLMEYAIARAREADCYKIGLMSNKRRQEAHQFYRSLGFEASAEGFRLYF